VTLPQNLHTIGAPLGGRRRWGCHMRTLTAFFAITLFAFSSSAFAQYDDGTLSCAEWCIERSQNAGQYARTGCVMQCPGNCLLRRYEQAKKNSDGTVQTPGDCPQGSCARSGKRHACDLKNCSPNNCAGGARQGAKPEAKAKQIAKGDNASTSPLQ
jgi:hypothetical protein